MATYSGTPGDDIYAGGPDGDSITGGAGNDHLSGGDGDDGVEGEDGDDVLFGDAGDDYVYGGAGNDRLEGGAGSDVLQGEAGDDILIGGDGNDLLIGGPGVDLFDGGSQSATLFFRPWGDTITFSEPRATQGVVADLRTGVISNDGFGNVETMTGIEAFSFGTAFADFFYGNDAPNRFVGGRGDTVMAFGGDDVILVGRAPAVVDGGDGIDSLVLGAQRELIPSPNGGSTAVPAPWVEAGYTVDLAAGVLTDPNGNTGSVAGIERVTGTGYADVLLGTAADEWFAPLSGSDTIDGRGGIDTVSYAGAHHYTYWYDYQGGMFIDLAAGQANETSYQHQTTGSGFSVRAAAPTGRTGPGDTPTSVDTLAGVEIVEGTGLGDTIYGDDHDNVFRPGAGNDLVDGRGGIDTVDYSPARAAVSISLQNGTATESGTGETDLDISDSQFGTTVQADDYSATADQLIGIENAIGSGFGDMIVGDSGANRLEGGAGNDIITGQEGADTILGGDGDDILSAGLFGDPFAGASPNYSFPDLGSDVDTLDGGAGNDVLAAGYGDNVDGGSGFDSLRLDLLGAPAGVIADFSALASGGSVAIGGGTIAGIELISIVTGSNQADVLDAHAVASGFFILSGLGGNDVIKAGATTNSVSGGDGDDTIDASAVTYQFRSTFSGDAGNDLLIGGFGVEDLKGGTGNDVYRVSDSRVAVIENPGEGIDEVQTSLGAYILTANVENLTGLGTSQLLIGNTLDNAIAGGSGDDVLDGGAGVDTLTGGAGSDVYYVDSLSDIVIENVGAGYDEVRTYVSNYVLPANVEKLTYIGSGAGDIRGNAGDNVLTGGSGGDFLRLQDGGYDIADMGDGNDAAYFGAAFDAGDRVDGGAGKDVLALQGDYSGGLSLVAGSVTGVETLTLLPHTDTRFGGGSANGFVYVITALDEAVAAGTQLIVNASTLEVGEALFFDGHLETDGSFFFYGGLGNDVLTGGAQADVFFFGENGRFVASDHVDGGAGADILVLRGDYDLTLSAGSIVNVETVTLMSGTDARFAPAGTPFHYAIATAEDTVAAGQVMTFNGGGLGATETLHFDGSAEAGGGAYRVFGGAADDIITGGNGNDLIFGGLGADVLKGGAGADTFRYQSVLESIATAMDKILDFASGDHIEMARAGHFAFIGSDGFGHHAGELRVEQQGTSNVWTVQADADGDGAADFVLQVTVTDNHQLTASDFVF